MIRKIFAKIFFILAIILLVYIVFIDMLFSFSISMNLCFVVSVVLLFLLYYVMENPIDEEKREPSFMYIFVKVSSVMFFGFMIVLLIFNVGYPKKFLDDVKGYDYIIVFGAGVKKDKTEIINSRLDTAVNYANIYKNAKFILTGAKGKDEPIEEAYYMQNYMVVRGIDGKRIIVDPFSINTNENIINSLELIKTDVFNRNKVENLIPRPINKDSESFDMDFLNIGLMSSDFHLTRINLMAKKIGIKNIYDISCPTLLFYMPYMYIRENLSLFKAFVLGQISVW